MLDVINHAKFQLDRFRGFGAPGGRKSLSPIDWRYRPYNSVRTNVLHCDIGLPTYKNGGKLLNGVDGRSVVVSTWRIGRVVVKQTNSFLIPGLILSKLFGSISHANCYPTISAVKWRFAST